MRAHTDQTTGESPSPLGIAPDDDPGTNLPRSPSAAPLEETGDARLVERARDGDEEAFAALVRRYERKLLRVLTRLVHDHELARDLAQETLWRVYHRLDRFDTSRRFGPWLFRIAVNLGVDQLRRRNGPTTTALPLDSRRDDDDRRGPSALDITDPDPRPREELAQEVRFVLEQLPVKDRTILVLRDLEGFSSAEVAAIIQRREATIRWRLSKAREQFRRLWERRMAQQDHDHEQDYDHDPAQGGAVTMSPHSSSEARHAD